MERAIVTGATSPLGIALVRTLLQDGVAVAALTRPHSRNLYRLPEDTRVKLVPCALAALERLPEKSVGQADAFFHLGWDATDKTGRDDPVLQQQNIISALGAVQLAKRCGCRTFVGAGSQAEYGPVQGVVTETTPCRPVLAYGMAKLAAAQLTRKLCGREEITHVWCRIFSLYGRYDGADTMVSYCLRTLLEQKTPRLSACIQPWDYLHYDDAARALMLLAQHGGDGATYNCASGQTHPLRYFTEIMRLAVSKDARVHYDAVKKDGSVYGLEPDVARLRGDTGFLPAIPFPAGIDDMVAWMKGERHA